MTSTAPDLYLAELAVELRSVLPAVRTRANDWHGTDARTADGDVVRVCPGDPSEWEAGATVHVFLAGRPHVVAASATVAGVDPVTVAQVAAAVLAGARR